MMGKAIHREAKLFHVGFNLDDRVPADHVLRRVDAAVDFSFVRPMVAALYGYNGHESLDPALVLRLLFLCFFENVRSERELMRQLPLRLDWLWFCGLDVDDPAPDHSVLSKARRRWGERTFERVFAHVLGLCRDAGLLEGRTVHADSTLLRASASPEGRVSRVLWEQLEAARAEADAADGRGVAAAPEAAATGDEAQDRAGDGDSGNKNQNGGGGANRPKLADLKVNQRLVSPVDPDAAATTRRSGGTTLGYRDHRLVDDRRGVILATVATPADADDGAMLPALLERQRDYTDTTPREVVGDGMYGTRDNYATPAKEGVKAYLKKRRGKDSPKASWLELLPADCSRGRALELLGRRKSRAEGSFAEAHVRMNHRRCRWRRRWRVQIQCYLVAAVQNIKRLAGLGRGRRPSARAAAPGSLVTKLVTWIGRHHFVSLPTLA